MDMDFLFSIQLSQNNQGPASLIKNSDLTSFNDDIGMVKGTSELNYCC